MAIIDLGATLKKMRQSKNMTIADLEDALKGDLDYNTLYRMESVHKTVSIPKLQIIAAYHGVSVTDIFRDAEGVNQIDPDITGQKKVPVLSWVQAGNWTDSPAATMADEPNGTVIAPKTAGPNCFALHVKGESMQTARGPSFTDGSIIIVDPDREANNNDFVIARFEESGESTFKQLIIDGPNKILRALNQDFPPIQLNGSVVITGVIIGNQQAF